jgi:PAS domain S-box-containing protein
MKICIYYFFIICINLMPFIPLSSKGILGLVFIIISSVKSDFKGTIRTTIILIILETYSYIMGFSVDYKHGTFTMFLGSLLYLTIAYFLGKFTEKIRNLIKELRIENEVRRNIEKELKQKIALQNSIMYTMPTPLFIKDLEFNYVGINSAFSDLLGISEKDLIGKNVFHLFDTYIAETCNQMDIDLINKHEKQVKEISVLANDGNMKTIIISKVLIIDDEDKPSGIVGVMLDITEQMESEKLKTSIAEDKLIIDELKKDDKLKTEFFSNISHELRTPLNVIFSAVQLVEMHVNDSNYIINQNKIRKNIISIRQNCLRLQRLVNNLIDISKIDARAFDLRLQNLDIVYIVEEITLSVADFISNKGISLVFDTNAEEKIMAFDEEKIERIILNLLSNAIKYTPGGGMISVSIVDRGENVIIQIKDSGIGIPQDKLDLVFNRFYQISPMNTRHQEGSGIGLNLVKSLVEMHQGVISVDSVLGKGTNFSINLPRKVIGNETAQQPIIFDKQSRIEKIQLEFSDIYKITNRTINDN